ncbi:MAG: zinc ribbon domain-containing protein [Candidatus Thermoplasmatota archaeon]|nr:hypothetical protein [Euryarchaeota archaeon]MBU4032009.1 zinc ribbon domain-containing protein [Candidatus Thermoplasmatota archaeon]MBU4071787.1 zinc ribbon domain-containing protein [Candidatus Thermoplasmatota archaeon]MBU4143902.1 zinc ribbon domain-containing protein [Candidatus Thermoplasmatota archaeon]MBU4592489.1 zinc ribbon domain-containing protein [Candidatus Thermoplasmatota archaeon]
MKDSAKLLNFNVNRELNFSVFRSVDVNTRRALSFQINRDLNFSSNRDLGFGKRGVVFRGYVCPICGAPVAKNAPQCAECGVKFEQPAKEQKKEIRQNEWDRELGNQEPDQAPDKPTRKASPKSSRVQAPERRSTFGCPVCGKVLYVGTERCPGCAAQFTSSTAIPPPPQGNSDVQTTVICTNCNSSIQPKDQFCRRCGSARPKGSGKTLISWDEYNSSGRDDGIVSWDEYSKRNNGG